MTPRKHAEFAIAVIAFTCGAVAVAGVSMLLVP